MRTYVSLPCKIGDTMWGIRNFKGFPSVQRGEVSEMFFSSDMELVIVLKYICRGTLGKRVFRTSEEAYKYLEKVAKSKNEKR